MANHKSALKRHRQNLKQNERNRAAKSSLKTATKNLMAADKKDAPAILKKLQSQLSKAGRKKLIHPRAAAKRMSKAMKMAASK